MEEKKKSFSTPTDLKYFVIWGLRKLSYKYAVRYEARKAAMIDRNQYLCASCKKIFKSREIFIDHIDPVIDPKKGFTNFDDYIKRLFCAKEGFQVLCKDCHAAKTLEEKDVRKKYRKKRKKKDGKDM